jgi:hypothetical protein
MLQTKKVWLFLFAGLFVVLGGITYLSNRQATPTEVQEQIIEEEPV